MCWDAEVAAEWEKREHKIRQEIIELRESLNKTYQGKWETTHRTMQEKGQSRFDWYDNAIHSERAKLNKLYEMPILGRFLRQYAGEDG